MITAFKELLPKKAKCEHFPQIIWMAPPMHKYFHNNDQRLKFTEMLESLLPKYPEMAMLSLKKYWDDENRELYLHKQGRYTPIGLQTYWLAVDAAVKFWDKTLSEILQKGKRRKSSASLPTTTHTHKHRNPSWQDVIKKISFVTMYSSFLYHQDIIKALDIHSLLNLLLAYLAYLPSSSYIYDILLVCIFIVVTYESITVSFSGYIQPIFQYLFTQLFCLGNATCTSIFIGS